MANRKYIHQFTINGKEHILVSRTSGNVIGLYEEEECPWICPWSDSFNGVEILPSNIFDIERDDADRYEDIKNLYKELDSLFENKSSI